MMEIEEPKKCRPARTRIECVLTYQQEEALPLIPKSRRRPFLKAYIDPLAAFCSGMFRPYQKKRAVHHA